MPNYEKTTIYKISCIDPTVTETYIGSTCNYQMRKAQHKYNSTHENRTEYDYPLYQCIRQHGGFDNWRMEKLEDVICNNIKEKLTKEREHYEINMPSLNRKHPGLTRKETIQLYRFKKLHLRIRNQYSEQQCN